MRILMLGGTGFVGRHVALAAIAAGHDVTFANRGETDPGAFASHPHVRIDRYDDVAALKNVAADAVIDTSGYTPDSVAATARALAHRAKTYVFMSSIDAYNMNARRIDESSATKHLQPGDSTARPEPELYGAQKVRCEELLVETLGAERVLVVRAGFMMGPYDNTDRFTYWPVRATLGGETLAPDSRELPLQLIDARDVAAWIVRALAARLHGTYNLVGNSGEFVFGDVVDACERVTGSRAVYSFVTNAFLIAQNVEPWVELPLWLPESPEFRGLRNISNARATQNGLRIRPLDESVRDILFEYASRSQKALRAGLTRKREQTLLRAWKKAT